jgi:predicted transglutaminase-like cysteine proteinase
LFSTAELEGMHAMMRDASIPPAHYGAIRSALAKIGNELERRKLVPASENPYQALARIGAKVNADIEKRKSRHKRIPGATLNRSVTGEEG